MDPALNIAVRAARRAGDLIIRQMDAIDRIPVTSKGRNDFVSDVDRQAEGAIIEIIHKAYPTHGILAEESGARPGDEFQWIVDPLDGTTNYLHGFPQFAVSIALKLKNRLEQGVIYDPLRQELFTASRGKGALLNDRRIRVSRQRHLKGALLGTGFPFRGEAQLERFLGIFRVLAPITAGIRRAGAASLDLAYVACARLDGFWELGLKEWDIAAGYLLICEAGGLISDIDGEADCLATGNVLAANPSVYKAMLRQLAAPGK